ncbi:hypothetical protein N8I74_06425 [Chitiniphilus purpureus]|uniref:Uncharacterized protein n=1 Tax=Chitiniphilus purpureus TaxID=2981137 RepID=A0ABY6DQL1_9NEIS|nr:hypothetical protein [Chitiniphilus sp. CD1]UXY16651.1 hypothetical protein N8I74_06425 [Chitiniphilus sp. CD1]
MTPRIVLDCETFEATLESLARIFQTTPDTLHTLLSAKEIDAHFEIHWRELPEFKEYVYAIVEKHFGSPLPLDAVCWFHTTRIFPGTNFSEGILPLGAALPALKERLVQAVDDAHIREQLQGALHSNSIIDFHYSNKTQNPIHWGPYAILVKEVALHATELGQHDYLGMPEIIEDICNGFENVTGTNLIPEYSTKLKPAIVKFTHASDRDESCIATALCYAHSRIQKGIPCANSVTCFDGKNNPVPPRCILRVEIVE